MTSSTPISDGSRPARDGGQEAEEHQRFVEANRDVVGRLRQPAVGEFAVLKQDVVEDHQVVVPHGLRRLRERSDLRRVVQLRERHADSHLSLLGAHIVLVEEGD